MRGENLDDWRQLVGIEGTSPRARGKHSPSMFSTSSSRNIPACAGKTAGIDQADANRQEHPRVRGENREVFEGEDFYSGTSPRTRVKQVVDAEKRLDLGNIPAHAGKTLHQTGAENHAAEHPRARGENTLDMMLQEPTRGTSPRTRGKPHPQARSQTPIGNIPAHAGKTLALAKPPGSRAEHPPARGENFHMLHIAGGFGGTSPRTRGKHDWGHVLEAFGRNIPAHAGKTP